MFLQSFPKPQQQSPRVTTGGRLTKMKHVASTLLTHDDSLDSTRLWQCVSISARGHCKQAKQSLPRLCESDWSRLDSVSGSECKLRLVTGHEGPQCEYRYSSTLSLTIALEDVGWLTPRPGRFNPGKDTRYPLHRRLGGPQGRSGRERKISPPAGFDPRTVQPVTSRYTDCATPAHLFVGTHPYHSTTAPFSSIGVLQPWSDSRLSRAQSTTHGALTGTCIVTVRPYATATCLKCITLTQGTLIAALVKAVDSSAFRNELPRHQLHWLTGFSWFPSVRSGN